MSSFTAKKLDMIQWLTHNQNMRTTAKTRAKPDRIMKRVRQRIERGGERLWRFEDFRDLSFSAVAQALSRLRREGSVERLSKGVYYRNRDTALGKSRPNPTAIRSLASRRKTVFPSGMAAANLLGFTTQMPRQGEIATSALSLPRKLVGNDTLIHTRRPEAWAGLTEKDAALLDILRHGAKFTELSQEDTIRKLLALLSEQGRLKRLLKVADSEPPPVPICACPLLGQTRQDVEKIWRPRRDLNPCYRRERAMS